MLALSHCECLLAFVPFDYILKLVCVLGSKVLCKVSWMGLVLSAIVYSRPI